MKTLQISERDFKKMCKLHRIFYEIYGDENTVWKFDDVEEMRRLGQEFMWIFFKYQK